MQGVEHNGHEKLTLLELVLRLHGEFRRSLEPIRMTPLQAGMLLFLNRHATARLTESAAALRVNLPTLSEVVKDLVRKRWVTKRRSVTDRRAV
jgi:DNA-binding MarR family transcriptional regulator